MHICPGCNSYPVSSRISFRGQTVSRLLSFAHPSEPTNSWDTSLSTPCRHTPANSPLDQEERSQGRTSRHMQLWWPRSCRQRQYSFALSSPPKSYFCLVVLYFFLLFVVHICLFGCLCSFPKSERAFNAKTWNGDKNGDSWRCWCLSQERVKEMFVWDNYKTTFSQNHLHKFPLCLTTCLTS